MDSSGDRVSLLCVDKHPTQPHLLAAGGQDGVLSIWDMRQELYPVTLLEAHSAESKMLYCCSGVYLYVFTVLSSLVTLRLLRATVCKYRESGVSREIFNFFIFCPNNLYSELFSKILFKGPEAL